MHIVKGAIVRKAPSERRFTRFCPLTQSIWRGFGAGGGELAMFGAGDFGEKSLAE